VAEDKIDVEFENPPLIETVLGVQFATLPGLSNVQMGLFWKTLDPNEWKKVTEALPLPDQFEQFEEKPTTGQVQLLFGPMPGRLQISHENGGRMIQLQPTRFHYNWNRVGGDYPAYNNVRGEFDHYFDAFSRFASKNGVGEVIPNQWELTYIDSIPKGPLWESPANWCDVLPGLFGRPQLGETAQMESFGGEWHFEIPSKRGRVHMAVQLARLKDEPAPILMLQTTARGPIGKEGAADLHAGLEIGHRAILGAFLGVTSEKAQKAWGRKT
jgi:uncharacterized protein (TIGR04255 family)